MSHREKQEELRNKLANIMGRKRLSFLRFAAEIGINVATCWAFLRRNSNLHQGNYYKVEQYVQQQEMIKEK